MADISNRDDVIDSRDVIERITELESELADLTSAVADAESDEERADAEKALAEWQDDYAAEFKALQELADEAESYAPDWHHGTTLIRESYWESYVQDMLEDCGEIPRDLPSYIVIDWEATASNIRVDYITVDFDGVDYLVR